MVGKRSRSRRCEGSVLEGIHVGVDPRSFIPCRLSHSGDDLVVGHPKPKELEAIQRQASRSWGRRRRSPGATHDQNPSEGECRQKARKPVHSRPSRACHAHLPQRFAGKTAVPLASQLWADTEVSPEVGVVERSVVAVGACRIPNRQSGPLALRSDPGPAPRSPAGCGGDHKGNRVAPGDVLESPPGWWLAQRC